MTEPPSPVASPSARQERPKVLYVMGAGRSGSTILGVTLGNCPGVFYAGELDAWTARAGEPQLDGAERARFWSAVRSDVGGEELDGLQSQRYLERSLALFRVHKLRTRFRLRKPYRRVAEDLYRAIWRSSGAELIVDTSHYPLRARELQALDGIDLYLLYLVRDPQRVVASFNRRDVAQYTKATLTTNVYLWLTSLLSVIVFRRQPRDHRLFVRYEDFVASPESSVREILAHMGARAATPDFAALETGIPFQGNRLIRSETIALERPIGPPESSSRITRLLQLPWLAIHSCLRPTVGTNRESEHEHALHQ